MLFVVLVVALDEHGRLAQDKIEWVGQSPCWRPRGRPGENVTLEAFGTLVVSRRSAFLASEIWEILNVITERFAPEVYRTTVNFVIEEFLNGLLEASGAERITIGYQPTPVLHREGENRLQIRTRVARGVQPLAEDVEACKFGSMEAESPLTLFGSELAELRPAAVSSGLVESLVCPLSAADSMKRGFVAIDFDTRIDPARLDALRFLVGRGSEALRLASSNVAARWRAQRMTALMRTERVLERHSSVGPLLNTLANEVRTLLGVDIVTVLRFTGGSIVDTPAIAGRRLSQIAPNFNQDLLCLKPRLVSSTASDEFCKRLRDPLFAASEGIKSTAILPLALNNALRGMLLLDYRDERHFEDREQLFTLIPLCAAALELHRTGALCTCPELTERWLV